MADGAWQEAWVEVLPDFSNFRRKADPQIRSILGDAGDAAGFDGSQRFGNSFAGGIGKLAAPIGAAIAALGIGYMVGDAIRTGIDWVSEGIALASDLSESVNAVQQSYGAAGDAVLALGENSADSMALTKAELNSFAVQFSAFSKTLNAEDPAGAFAEITARGVDFASVMNLEVADALGLFQSGLAGETEPLRKYGIDVSAAAVTTYALANGIADSAATMTEAQKVQARFGLIMQATNDYAGDFANTSDGLANSQRRLSASFRETQTSAGEIFLPLMTQLANVANTELVPALQSVIDKSGPELAAALADAVPAIVEFANAIIPLLPELVKLGVEVLPPLIQLLTALLPPVVFITSAYVDFFNIASAVSSFLAGDTTLNGLLQKLLALSGPIGNLNRSIYEFGATVASTFNGIRATIEGALAGAGAWLYSSGQALIRGFVNGIKSMIGAVGSAVSGVISWAMGFFPNSPAERGPLSGPGWNKLARSGEAVMTQFSSGFSRPDLTGALTPVLAGVTPAIRSAYASAASASPGDTYVQNPFTGEYLLAQVGKVAGAVVSARDSLNEQVAVAGMRVR